MAIKPVDLQVMIPKTQEVSKIKSDEKNKNNTFQQQEAILTQKNADTKMQKVTKKDNVSQEKVKEKENRNKKEEENKNNKNKKKDEKGSSVDIKI